MLIFAFPQRQQKLSLHVSPLLLPLPSAAFGVSIVASVASLIYSLNCGYGSDDSLGSVV